MSHLLFLLIGKAICSMWNKVVAGLPELVIQAENIRLDRCLIK